MKILFYKIRLCLRKNKIFFETITALTLSAMAIIVSYNSKNIASISKDIAYQNSQPYFNIFTTNKNYDPLKKTFRERQVDIYCSAGRFTNLNTEIVNFYNIKFKNNLTKIIEIQIPFENYMIASFPGDREEKNIRKIVGINNLLKEDSLRYIVTNILTQLKFEIISAYTISYLKIEYLDLLNKKTVLFFDVTDYESKLLINDGGKSVFNNYNTMIKNKIYFDGNKLEIKTIKSTLETYISKENE